MQRTNIFWRGQGMADRSPDLIYVTGHVGARALVALSSPGVVKQWEWRVRDNRTPPAVIITKPLGYFKALTLTKLLRVCVCVFEWCNRDMCKPIKMAEGVISVLQPVCLSLDSMKRAVSRATPLPPLFLIWPFVEGRHGLSPTFAAWRAALIKPTAEAATRELWPPITTSLSRSAESQYLPGFLL